MKVVVSAVAFQCCTLASLVGGFLAPPLIWMGGRVGVRDGSNCDIWALGSRRSFVRRGSASESLLPGSECRGPNCDPEPLDPPLTDRSRRRFLEDGNNAVLAALGLSSGWVFGSRLEGQIDGVAPDAEAASVDDEGSSSALQKQVLLYIREALPGWRRLSDSDIKLKQIKGGITNVIFKAYNGVSGEGALVRIYGKDTDLLLDRTKEAAVFSELSTLGFGPRKLGEFKGGRVEELLDARATTPAELVQTRSFDVPQAIAGQLADLHKQRVQSSAGSVDQPVMWTTIDRWLATATKLDTANKYPLEKVADEVAWLKKQLPGSPPGGDAADADQLAAHQLMSRVVFAHNDLLSGNVLVGPRDSEKISTLRLIDYEYSDYNPCGYDIANHFCECAGFDADYRRNYPSVDQCKHFLEAYVKAAKPEAFDNVLSKKTFLNALAERVDRYTLASHLTWALWAIIQTKTSEIEDFDFAAYAWKRLDGYKYHKYFFFGLVSEQPRW